MLIEYKFKSDLGAIPELTRNIFKKLEASGINEDNLFDIRLSLEEALVNAIKHGNKMDKNKEVSLKIKVLPKKVEIEVSGEGRGFDYKNIPLPTDEENIAKPYGRGIFLIKNLMDNVEFFDGGNKIKMVKLLDDKGGKP
jgi:serine/threonine-protein kinase RsbW